MTPASSSPRASRWEWAQAALLALNLAWTTVGFGGHLAETMAFTTVLVALSLALHFARRAWSSNEAKAKWHPAGWLFVPFLVYAAVNVRWVTPVRWLGWQDWLGWAHFLAIFWVALNDLRARATRLFVFNALLVLAVGAVGLSCYQRFAQPDWLLFGRTQAAQFLERSSGPFFVPNSLAALLVLLIPATLLPVFRRGSSAITRVTFGYLALLLLLGLGLTISRGAWLGLAVALIGWPLCASRVRWGRRIGLALAVAGAIAAVATTVYFSAPNVRDRLDRLVGDAGEKSRPALWRAAWKIFSEHRAWGAGAGSYNALFEPHRPEHEQKDPQWAHSDYLNTLADYGLAGFGLFFGAAGVVAWCTARRRRVADAARAWDWFDSRAFSLALAVGLAAFCLHLAVDFHLKIPALAFAAALVAALIVAREWPVPVPSAAETATRPAQRVYCALALVVLAGAGFGSNPLYRAEAVRYAARRKIDTLAKSPALPAERLVMVNVARAAFSRALELDSANAQAWADRAYTNAILGYDAPSRLAELGPLAESDARRAVALTPVVAEFWLRLGVALDMQRRWAEAGVAVAEGLRLAPVSAQAWFYYAYHLSLNPVTVPLARSAIATSLRLDHSAPEAEVLRQHLAAPR